MHTTRPASSRRIDLEQGEPLHRLDRRRSQRQGPRRSARGRRLLKAGGFAFDFVYTSVLKRAIWTSVLALDELDQLWLPVERHWRLNERHYGALQGLNKAETAAKHGEDQVKIWRRALRDRAAAARAATIRAIPRAIRATRICRRPTCRSTESLKDTVARFLPYWHESIAPRIAAGQRVLIAAHGNSLARAREVSRRTSPTTTSSS